VAEFTEVVTVMVMVVVAWPTFAACLALLLTAVRAVASIARVRPSNAATRCRYWGWPVAATSAATVARAVLSRVRGFLVVPLCDIVCMPLGAAVCVLVAAAGAAAGLRPCMTVPTAAAAACPVRCVLVLMQFRVRATVALCVHG
jgi:hypothetical protein